MGDTTLSGEVKLDVTNYKAGVTELNRQIRVIESGFKASAAALGDWSKTSTGLEQRIRALTGEISTQTNKVDGLQRVYDELAAGGKTSAKELAELEIKINRETESLNKMQVELTQSKTALDKMGSESKAAGNEVKALGDKEEVAKRKTQDFSGALTALKTTAKLAITAIVGIATATVGLAIGLGKTIEPASDLNETISKIQVVFGDLSDDVIHFGESSAIALGMSENAALTAAGTYGNLFRSMGIGNEISADMSVGLVNLGADLASFNNMDPTEVLDKLRSGLTGETEPLKVLGINLSAAEIEAKALEMGFKKVNGVLDASSKAQASYALIMEQTALAQGDFTRTSGGFANQQRIAAAQVENLKAKLGNALLPSLNAVMLSMNEWLANPAIQNGLVILSDGIGNIAANTQELVTDILSIVSGSGDVGDIAGKLGERLTTAFSGIAEKVPQFMDLGLTVLQGIIKGVISNLPQLIPAVISIISSLVTFIGQNFPLLVEAAIQILVSLTKGILEQLPMLLQTAIDIVIALATGITEALPELIPAIVQIIPQIITTLMTNFPLIVQAALDLIIALAQGLIAALPFLIPQGLVIVQALIDAIIATLPILYEAAVELMTTLVTGIIDNLPMMIDSATKVIETVKTTVLGLKETLTNVGVEIVRGIWQGIQDKTEWFSSNVMHFFAGIIDDVKKALGISSPSKVFAEIGQYMALGLGSGFTQSMKDVKNQIGKQLDFGTGNIALTTTASAGKVATASNTYNFYFQDTTLDEGKLLQILKRQELLYGA